MVHRLSKLFIEVIYKFRKDQSNPEPESSARHRWSAAGTNAHNAVMRTIVFPSGQNAVGFKRSAAFHTTKPAAKWNKFNKKQIFVMTETDLLLDFSVPLSQNLMKAMNAVSPNTHVVSPISAPARIW